ncbi:MAG: aminotransferase class V-fold PLP-dependent enzyme [Pseudomonadota bacterium]|nr:aminotransferase class V-fold PLP-dependent enzyme [Pseudomonadota bacterium]
MSTSAQLGDRSLFPDLAARSYLAHCAISPVSLPVREAVIAYVDSYARLGVVALGRWLDQRAVLRGALATLIGAGADDIALVSNTTTGVIDIAFAIAWRPGDRVVIFEGEFPANVTPWQQAAATFGLTLARLPLTGFGLPGEGDPGDGLLRLEACLREGARLVAVSAVQFQTGLAMPIPAIAALCRRYDAELFVDAIQGAGVVPIDVSCGVDYLTCGSHKWLLGIEGSAFLYVAPHRVGALVPRLGGWLSHEDPVGFLFGTSPLRYDRALRARADVFEGGAANGAGLAALGAAVELLARLGIPAVHAHVQRWHDAVEPGLLARGFTSLRSPHPGGRSGILALRAPADIDVQGLVRGLASRGVIVSAPENNLRIAPSWPNALSEVPVVLAAIDEARSAATAR